MPNEKIKHLEFIQDVIARMNQNSFQMKGWMVAIASTLLALYASTKNEAFALVAVFPTLVFWFLDSYYLQQERKFRGLYNDVAGTCEKPQEIKLFAMRRSVSGRQIFLLECAGFGEHRQPVSAGDCGFIGDLFYSLAV